MHLINRKNNQDQPGQANRKVSKRDNLSQIATNKLHLLNRGTNFISIWTKKRPNSGSDFHMHFRFFKTHHSQYR